jgi:hypothetical protein
MSGQLLTLAAFTPEIFPLVTRQTGCWVVPVSISTYIAPASLGLFEEDIDQIEKNKMGGTCSAYGERRVEDFGGET